MGHLVVSRGSLVLVHRQAALVAALRQWNGFYLKVKRLTSRIFKGFSVDHLVKKSVGEKINGSGL